MSVVVLFPPYTAPHDWGEATLVDADPSGGIHRWIGADRPTGTVCVEEPIVYVPEPIGGWWPKSKPPLAPPEPVFTTRMEDSSDVPYDLAVGWLVLSRGVVVGLTIAATASLR